ncbi:MAG: hypothetical protein HYU66_22005 [Armatimonadetes bacterium]|nr:hypothetical protein [Armatimonadota bacterium]
MQGRVVLVIGKTESNDGRGNGSASVIVEKLLPTEEWQKARRAAEQQPAKAAPRGGNGRTNGHTNGDETPAEPAGPALTDLAAVDVRVRVGQHFPERLGALARALREHPGEVPVVLWLEGDAEHRRLKLAQDFATTWSEALAQAVERIGGCSIRPVE